MVERPIDSEGRTHRFKSGLASRNAKLEGAAEVERWRGRGVPLLLLQQSSYYVCSPKTSGSGAGLKLMS